MKSRINKENTERFIVDEAEIETIPFSETDNFKLEQDLVGKSVHNYVDEYSCIRTGINFEKQLPTCSKGVLVYDKYAGATGHYFWNIFNFDEGTIIKLLLDYLGKIIGAKGYHMQKKDMLCKELVE